MSTPIPPNPPANIFVDENGKLSREGFEYLKRIETLLNQVRTAMIAAGFPP